MGRPENLTEFKKDLYRMAAGLAIISADLGILVETNPKNSWERAAVIGSGALAGFYGGLKAMRMVNEPYENHDSQPRSNQTQIT